MFGREMRMVGKKGFSGSIFSLSLSVCFGLFRCIGGLGIEVMSPSCFLFFLFFLVRI